MSAYEHTNCVGVAGSRWILEGNLQT